jgi:CRISPR-associated protein Cas1
MIYVLILKIFQQIITYNITKLASVYVYDVFGHAEKEERFVNNMPYEKIVMSGKGYVSTEALSLLSKHNRNLILVDKYGTLWHVHLI